MKFLLLFILLVNLFANNKIKIITLEKKEVKNIFSLLPLDKNETKRKKIKISKNGFKFPFYVSFSLDLLKTNKEEMSYLIKKYNKKLPFRDKLEGLIKLKRISEAKKVAFENLKKSNEPFTYKQIRDFYMNYANRLKIENSFVSSKNISYFKNKNSIKNYCFRGYYLYLKNENYLNNKYSNIYIFKVGVKELLNKGYNYFEVGERNLKLLFLFKNYNYYHKFEFNSYVGRDKADESEYLLFNTTKNYIKEDILYHFTNRNFLNVNFSFNSYNNKESFLGNGFLMNLKYIQKLRVTYPDFSYYIFSNFNHFTKNINLPKSSCEVGVGGFFGLNQKEIYHHTIKPFVDTSLTYNCKFGSSVNFLAGVSGRVFRSDNLSFSINDSKSLNGNNIFEYKLNYIYWF